MDMLNPNLKPPYDILKPDVVKTEVLRIVDYEYKDKRDIIITIEQPEFTSVCPMTGLPDHGCITIEYIPDQQIVELKSLKYYFLQYRNVGTFYEHLANKILEDLTQVLSPKKMVVRGNFTARGGISTQVKAEYQKMDKIEKE